VALVTNLSPNHLDWHPDLDHYYEAKRNIIRFQKPHDTAVLNAEDPVLRSWAEGCTGRRAFYGLDDPGTPNAAFVRSGRAFLRVAGHEAPAFQTADLPLPGRHNLLNALGASLAAGMLTHQTGPIKEGVSSFTGLPHRLEWVGEIDGRHYYNDSIATTPESVIAALTSFESPRVLIAGGYDKGIDFDELGRVVAGTAEAAVLLGDTAPKLHSAIDAAKASLGRAGDSRPVIHRAGSFEEAVRTAASLCPDGGAVLMSPGCASYDMFANFQERGEAFRRIVGQLGGKS
jgi:UDP-N-acetylmuramoylalanine--D-glutamate ligase